MVMAKKYYGQHFLNDYSIALRIISLLHRFNKLNNKINVLEVGPGKGILTRFLLRNEMVNLKMVEIDEEIVNFLETKYEGIEERIIVGDILKCELDKVFDGEEYVVIGNFPYNISTQIIFKIMEYKSYIPFVVGMFQKEVADRLSAKSSRAVGIMSIYTQAYYMVKKEFNVKADKFSPKPKVESSVITMQRMYSKRADVEEEKFLKLLKLSFNQRRKKLKNSLSRVLNGININDYMYLMDKRAEELTVEDYIKLSHELGWLFSDSNE